MKKTNLQKLFKEKGYKISHVAEKIGVSRQTLASVIKNTQNLKGATAKKLCEFLEVDYNFIYGEKV